MTPSYHENVNKLKVYADASDTMFLAYPRVLMFTDGLKSMIGLILKVQLRNSSKTKMLFRDISTLWLRGSCLL